MDFEISAYDISQGSGGEIVKIEARNLACQRLKRDKTRLVFKGGNASVFAAQKAREVGLKFFGENAFAKKTISQVSDGQVTESAWDVIKRLAGENQFVIFESDGRLFFTSQQFLLGKFALTAAETTTGFFSTPVHWLTEHNSSIITFTEIPTPLTLPPLKPGMGKPNAVQRAAIVYLQKVLEERVGIACYYSPGEQPVQVVDEGGAKELDEQGSYSSATSYAVGKLRGMYNIGVSDTPNYTVDDAVWNVIKNLARGYETAAEPFWLTALECPECRKSDDDFNAATISFQVERGIGKSLRPGMTVRLVDMPGFTASYIITEVRWVEGVVGSVSVSARTPINPTDQKQLKAALARLDFTGGGYTSSVVENQFGSQ
jgi:hypothetical protein